MKIDVGSGTYKRPGFIGVDVIPGSDTDVVCDIEREIWPFGENSIGSVFSSHCFEHVRPESMPHIFKELSRICRDGAELEIWHPYGFHRDGFVMGHINQITEEVYYHIAVGLQDVWAPSLGARWFLTEIRYHISIATQARLREMNIPEDFAIDHYNNIVKEIGIFLTIDKTSTPRDRTAFRRTIIDHMPDKGMRETRELNIRAIGTGPGSSCW